MKRSQVNLSVVVPVYNVEKYLDRCISSIVNQSYRYLEIILVDDGSSDASGKLCDEWKNRDTRIKCVHQRNGGLSAARNTGLEIASSDYITFVDSDDYIDPRMYEILMDGFNESDIDIVIGGVWNEQENGEKYTPYPANVQKLWTNQDGLVELNSFGHFDMSFCNKIFKRFLFEKEAYGEKKVRFPLKKLSEDFYIMYKIIARTNKIRYTSTPYYHYVQRENSISRNDNINLAGMDASVKQLNFFKQWFPEIIYAAETACFFSHEAIYDAYNRRHGNCPDELMPIINKICYKYLFATLRNPKLIFIKKIQALLFCVCRPLYKLVILHMRRG